MLVTWIRLYDEHVVILHDNGTSHRLGEICMNEVVTHVDESPKHLECGFILADGFIYSGAKHGKGFPICVELKTGEVKWGGEIRGEGNGSAAVTMADNQIIFRYQDGKLALVRATPSGYELNGTFKPEYQEKESWAHPVVSDGKLYLREQNKLMCYDLHE